MIYSYLLRKLKENKKNKTERIKTTKRNIIKAFHCMIVKKPFFYMFLDVVWICC